MTTEYNDENDPFLRPYQPDVEGELENGDDGLEEDDEEFAVDLEEAAAEFRMLYYGAENNPEPPAAMMELAPDVMRLVDAVVYGEIYNRPGVDLRTRSLCTIAALVVLGHSPQMIKRHITGALHIGVTQEEISEIIAQMVFYGGMPAAVNAFRIAKETFDEQAAQEPGGVTRQERAPRDTPSGYAPSYRRENIGNYGPDDMEEDEAPRVRPRSAPEPGESPGPDRGRGGIAGGPGPQGQPQRGPQGQPQTGAATKPAWAAARGHRGSHKEGHRGSHKGVHRGSHKEVPQGQPQRGPQAWATGRPAGATGRPQGPQGQPQRDPGRGRRPATGRPAGAATKRQE